MREFNPEYGSELIWHDAIRCNTINTMKYNTSFKIGNRIIGNDQPTYFIADIGANHDSSLERAKDLIKLAKDSGADCAKFQHFQANKIVSKEGFAGLKSAHQSAWEKSVYEVYEDYSINRDWNQDLIKTCKEVGIEFMTTPYDMDAADQLDSYVNAYKIGSGEITNLPFIRYIACSRKPIFLATGASTIEEVKLAVNSALEHNPNLCLMQCNTDYTAKDFNCGSFKNINLNVLKTYGKYWPDMPLGLSDHTLNQVTVLGAITLGARVIEKHFTDDHTRKGPDHSFALMPLDWMNMVAGVRQLEDALGDGIKRVEENEKESRIVQRRALRATRDIESGESLKDGDFEALRPCPADALTPAFDILGHTLSTPLKKGDALYPKDLV